MEKGGVGNCEISQNPTTLIAIGHEMNRQSQMRIAYKRSYRLAGPTDGYVERPIWPQVCDAHLVLYLLYYIIPSTRWFWIHFTIEKQEIHDILASKSDERRVRTGTRALGIPSWPTYFTATLRKFTGPVRPSKAWICWVMATYWYVKTWTTYICPSKCPSRSISVTIQQNHHSNW